MTKTDTVQEREREEEKNSNRITIMAPNLLT